MKAPRFTVYRDDPITCRPFRPGSMVTERRETWCDRQGSAEPPDQAVVRGRRHLPAGSPPPYPASQSSGNGRNGRTWAREGRGTISESGDEAQSFGSGIAGLCPDAGFGPAAPATGLRPGRLLGSRGDGSRRRTCAVSELAFVRQDRRSAPPGRADRSRGSRTARHPDHRSKAAAGQSDPSVAIPRLAGPVRDPAGLPRPRWRPR